jgi:hypothetical protein
MATLLRDSRRRGAPERRPPPAHAGVGGGGQVNGRGSRHPPSRATAAAAAAAGAPLHRQYHHTHRGAAPEVLRSAVARGEARAVVELTRRGADPTGLFSDASGETLLFIAAQGGHESVCAALLYAGAHTACVNEARYADGATPLHIAADKGHAAVIGALLGGGAAVDRADRRAGRTPLFHAAAGGRLDAALSLLGARADPSRLDAQGLAPLYAAAQLGHAALVRALLRAGAAVDGEPPPPPAGAAAAAAVAMTRHGPAPPRPPPPLFVPLHAAARQGHTEVARELLRSGGDPALCATNGRGALYLASEQGHAQVLSLLLPPPPSPPLRHSRGAHRRRFAEVDACATDGTRPLLAAVLGGHAECCRLLLWRGGASTEPLPLPRGARPSGLGALSPLIAVIQRGRCGTRAPRPASCCPPLSTCAWFTPPAATWGMNVRVCVCVCVRVRARWPLSPPSPPLPSLQGHCSARRHLHAAGRRRGAVRGGHARGGGALVQPARGRGGDAAARGRAPAHGGEPNSCLNDAPCSPFYQARRLNNTAVWCRRSAASPGHVRWPPSSAARGGAAPRRRRPHEPVRSESWPRAPADGCTGWAAAAAAAAAGAVAWRSAVRQAWSGRASAAAGTRRRDAWRRWGRSPPHPPPPRRPSRARRRWRWCGAGRSSAPGRSSASPRPRSAPRWWRPCSAATATARARPSSCSSCWRPSSPSCRCVRPPLCLVLHRSFLFFPGPPLFSAPLSPRLPYISCVVVPGAAEGGKP